LGWLLEKTTRRVINGKYNHIKQEELSQIFKEIEVNQSLIMSMFSLERLWIPFVFATKKRTWDVQEKIRECMDIVWERILGGVINIGMKTRFETMLDYIAEKYEDDNINYNYCFDNYLVNALYSNIGYFFDEPTVSGYKVRTTASIMVLDLLSDYIVDNLKKQNSIRM